MSTLHASAWGNPMDGLGHSRCEVVGARPKARVLGEMRSCDNINRLICSQTFNLSHLADRDQQTVFRRRTDTSSIGTETTSSIGAAGKRSCVSQSSCSDKSNPRVQLKVPCSHQHGARCSSRVSDRHAVSNIPPATRGRSGTGPTRSGP